MIHESVASALVIKGRIVTAQVERRDIIHRESKREDTKLLPKYWPIFKILSLLDSVGNL